MTELSVKDVLLRAADEIVRRGKQTGSFYSWGTLEDCRVCAEGALAYVATGHPVSHRRESALLDDAIDLLVDALGGEDESDIYNWSDKPDTSAADIAAKFREIAGTL